ncbi:MAG: hypothetical protein PHX83_16875 [Acidobacteriia bacterium]|nr:hypothetical protein [Terriglobia bacterium]
MDTDPRGGFGFPRGGGVLDGGTYFVRVICPQKTKGGVLQSKDFYLSPAYTTGNREFLNFICCPTGGVQALNDEGVMRDFGGRMESPKPKPEEKPPQDWHVQPIALSSAKFTYTDDWEHGNIVTFSVHGYVKTEAEGGEPSEQQTAVASGYVVDVADSAGHRSQIPWSDIMHYTVQAANGDITARLIRPDKTVVASTTIRVHPTNSPPPYRLTEPPKGNCVVPPISQSGEDFVVYSPTSKLSPTSGALTLIVKDESGRTEGEYQPLAQSPHSAIFHPTGTQTGPHNFTIKQAGVFEEDFTVHRIGVLLDTSRVYPKGKKGKLLVKVSGFPGNRKDPFWLSARDMLLVVDNKTPGVLAYTKEPNHIEWRVTGGDTKSDGSWEHEIDVQAVAAGRFEDTASLTTPICVNPTGLSRVFFKGPDAAPCPFQPGQVVHVDVMIGNKEKGWDLGVRPQGGERITVKLKYDEKNPSISSCNWIKIGACHVDPDGDVYIDSYVKVPKPPEKPPQGTKPAGKPPDVKPPEPPKPPEPQKPPEQAPPTAPEIPTGPGTTPKQPPPANPEESTGDECPYRTCAWLITIGPGKGIVEVPHSAISIDGQVVFSMEGHGMKEYPNMCAYLKKRAMEGRSVSVNAILDVDKPKMRKEAQAIENENQPYDLFLNNCALNAWRIMHAGGNEILKEPLPLRLQKRGEDLGVLGPRQVVH